MRVLLACLCLVAVCVYTAHAYNAGCFFSLQKDSNGADWIVDPDGKPFVVTGISNVHYRPDVDKTTGDRTTGVSPYQQDVLNGKYGGDKERWADDVVRELRRYNFNSAGAWSADEIYRRMPHVITLDIGGVNEEAWADYFDGNFEASVRADVQKKVAAHRSDSNLIGYFMGNELHWTSDYRTATTLLGNYMSLPAHSAGKQRAIRFLTEKFGSVNGLRDALPGDLRWINSFDDIARWQWPTVNAKGLPPPSQAGIRLEADWVAIVSQQYFSVVGRAIREADPNHLVFSVRMAGMGSEFIAIAEQIWRGMRGNVDVATLNLYNGQLFIDRIGDNWAQLADFHAWSGAPIMIGEFSFRGLDVPGLNTIPPGTDAWTWGWTTSDQQGRADGYARYLETSVWWPHIVGYQWFEYIDQPTNGRFPDGENCNFGIVNIRGEPYTTLLNTMTLVNKPQNMNVRHASGSSSGPFVESRIPTGFPPKCPGGSAPTPTPTPDPAPTPAPGNGKTVLLRTAHGQLIKCDGAANVVYAVHVPAGSGFGDEFRWIATDVQQGERITLQCKGSNKYLSVPDAGAGATSRYPLKIVSASNVDESFKFWVRPIVNGKDVNGVYTPNALPQAVALATMWGTFLAVQPDGYMWADKTSVDKWEQLTVMDDANVAPGSTPAPAPAPAGQVLLIRTLFGQLLKCDSATRTVYGAQVTANAALSDDFRFIVNDVQQGERITVQCKNHNQYLAVLDNGVAATPRFMLKTVGAAVVEESFKFWVRPIVNGLDVNGVYTNSFPQTVALASLFGTFLSVQPDGYLWADRKSVDTWEHFTLINNADRVPAFKPTVLIRTSTGAYLSAANDNVSPVMLPVNGSISDEVRFVVDSVGASSITLRNLKSNKYLRALQPYNGMFPLKTDSPSDDTWEHFDLFPVNNGVVSTSTGALAVGGKFAVRTFFGRYLSHDHNVNAITADRTSTDTWEQFTFLADLKLAL